jgi:hypothetical protein
LHETLTKLAGAGKLNRKQRALPCRQRRIPAEVRSISSEQLKGWPVFASLFRKWEIASLPRVASIATMPSRLATFRLVMDKILPQVDVCFVFLDNFTEAPSFIQGNRKIAILRSQERGDLHSAGRFLALSALERPSVISFIDDDISYPDDYILRLFKSLGALSDDAIVGVHGRKFRPPYVSYIQDFDCHHFADQLLRDTEVDELGTVTCAFLSKALNFDVRNWAYTDACDIQLAIEAHKRGMRRICIERPQDWLSPYGENQPDSCWTKTKANSSRQTVMMGTLLADRCESAAGQGSLQKQAL